VGLWTGNPLLLSMQAVSSLVVDLAWDLDLAARGLTGRHLIGGTEYMWDPKWPLWLRALSVFHVLLPPVLIAALRRTGFDRRALPGQAALALVVMVVSRLTLGPDENQNFTWRDPFLDRSWGPAAVHVGLTWTLLVLVVFWPTQALLARWLPPAASPGSRSRAAAR
jgi:hypothetical protein